MTVRQIKKFLVFSLFILFFPACLWANNALPEKWKQQLDANKRANQLEDWINTWANALSENPESTLAWSSRILNDRWRAPQTEDEHIAWINLLVIEGYNLLTHGTIIQSIAAYEKALSYYSNYPFIPPEKIVKQLFFPLSQNYAQLGDYAQVYNIQEKALSLIQNTSQVKLLATLYNNLAITCRWVGNPGQASIYASNGLDIPGIDRLTEAELLTTLADVELFREIDDSPENYIKEAYTILSHQKMNPDVAQRFSTTLQVYARIQAAAHHYPQALVYLDRSLHLLKTYFPEGKPLEKAKILAQTGNIYIRQANYQRALPCFTEAIKLLLPQHTPYQIYAEPTLMDVKLGLARSHAALHQPKLALDEYQDVFYVFEKLGQIFYSENSQYTQQQILREVAEEAIALAYAQYKKYQDPQYITTALALSEKHKTCILADEVNRHIAAGKPDEINTHLQQRSRFLRAISWYENDLILALINKQADTTIIRKNLKKVNQQLTLLQQQLTKQYPLFSSGLTQPTNKTKQQLANLPDSVQVQAYFCGFDYYYAFSYSKTGFLAFDRLENALLLDSVIGNFNRKYFQEGPTELYNRPKEYLQEGEHIYKLLFKQHSPERALIIIPDGALNTLPFDALITKPTQGIDVQKWPFLTKKYRLSYAYSIANWFEQTEGSKMRTHNGNFTGFFMPFMGIYGQDGLKAVKAEKTRVKNLVRGQYYWDDDAQVTTMVKQLPQSEVVHISTHAMLVGADRVPMLLFKDRRLLIPDLYPFMTQPSLVVLGACQSGSGWLDSGESLIGLAREFYAHGPGGVVSGLWNIDDELAAQFMEKFYKHLMAGENKAEALHSTKIEWLNDPKISPMNKLPYYWAGMIYNGDFERVHLRRAWPWANEVLVFRVLLVIFIVSAAGCLWWQRKWVASLFKKRKKRYW
ncbi:CHAT domain-containing protein [bacterium A37T11]|nr:CHAT domain-containing protein [bacterium A37T11]